MSEADKTIATVKKLGREATWHQADIGDSVQRKKLFDDFLKAHGRIDVLVNNAAQTKWTRFMR